MQREAQQIDQQACHNGLKQRVFEQQRQHLAPRMHAKRTEFQRHNGERKNQHGVDHDDGRNRRTGGIAVQDAGHGQHKKNMVDEAGRHAEQQRLAPLAAKRIACQYGAGSVNAHF